jgi:DivIVA domain-containing protein
VFWFQLAVVAFVLFIVAAVATGRGGSMGEAYPDRPDVWLPEDRPIGKAEVDRLRFSVGLRGYRMSEVDQVLDRLAVELEARDARIRELSGGRPYRSAPDYEELGDYPEYGDYRPPDRGAEPPPGDDRPGSHPHAGGERYGGPEAAPSRPAPGRET